MQLEYAEKEDSYLRSKEVKNLSEHSPILKCFSVHSIISLELQAIVDNYFRSWCISKISLVKIVNCVFEFIRTVQLVIHTTLI